MARVDTAVENGHTHQYEQQVSSSGRATQTSIVNGHKHPISRDDNGRAISIGRVEGHIHKLLD